MVGIRVGRRKPRLTTLAVLASCVGVFALLPMTASAVHDEGIFELDGNATAEAAPGDDWSSLFPTDTSTTDLGKAFETDLTGAAGNNARAALLPARLPWRRSD